MILVSLHTKSSSMFHVEFKKKKFPPKCRNLTMKTLLYKLRRLSICSFDQITSLLFPLSSHVLFTVCWPCAFMCWWCCNLLTSNQDLWLVRYKMYRDPCCTEYNMFYSKVCIIQLLKVAWYRVIAVVTLYFLVYDTSIMILALPCNRGFTNDHGYVPFIVITIRSFHHSWLIIGV